MLQAPVPADRQSFKSRWLSSRSLLVIFGAISVLTAAGLLLWVFASKNEDRPSQLTPNTSSKDVSTRDEKKKSGNQQRSQDPKEPPLKLKGIGVNLDYYDPQTGRAGDFVFAKQKLQFNSPFMPYGFVIPSNVTANGQDKANPQLTFILPLGTPVRSLVDGVVANMPTLWSGGISIQVTSSGQLERWVYETEHVTNPKVKVGDKVTAGQIVAEVSNFDKGAPAGYGAVEIGLLHGGGEGLPEHVCPFAYLDPEVKEDIQKKLLAFYKAWEEYKGDQTLYDEAAQTIPGCLTLDPIEG